jgi:hypothetical protein
MTNAESLPDPEPELIEKSDHVAQQDLIKLAEYVGQGRDYLASFTSLLSSKMLSLDDAVHMLGFKDVAEAKQRLLFINQLEELRRQHSKNIERSRIVGRGVFDSLSRLNPLGRPKS